MKILHLIILLEFLLLIFIISYFNIRQNKEYFQSTLLLSDNSYNFENTIHINNKDLLINIYKGIESSNNIHCKYLDENTNINVKDNIELKYNVNINCDSRVSVIIDPYSIMKYNITKYKPYLNGDFLYFSKLKDVTSTNQLNFLNKTIAYCSLVDYYFIKAIILSYQMDEKKINIVKIIPKGLLKSDHPFDILITNVVPNSEYFTILQNVNLYSKGFYNLDLNLIKGFFPFVNEKYITYNENAVEIKLMTPYITYSIIANISVVKDVKEPFITRFDISKDVTDPAYGCYNDMGDKFMVLNKYLCDSKYDKDDKLKVVPTKWDRKCMSNEECPYYKKNENYSNVYGGCIDGYCELPLGLTRTGYKTHEGSPYCYGCDPNDIECCIRQTKPDYAFANDYNDRVYNNLSTVIWDII